MTHSLNPGLVLLFNIKQDLSFVNLNALSTIVCKFNPPHYTSHYPHKVFLFICLFVYSVSLEKFGLIGVNFIRFLILGRTVQNGCKPKKIMSYIL